MLELAVIILSYIFVATFKYLNSKIKVCNILHSVLNKYYLFLTLMLQLNGFMRKPFYVGSLLANI